MCIPDAPGRLPGIPAAERLLLWGIRAWVVGVRRRIDADAAIVRTFAASGVAPAAPLIDPLMSVIACGATRRLTVDCVCHPHVSADERQLVQAAALHQAGRGFEACLLLRDALTASAARDAGAFLHGIGSRFLAARLRFVWLPVDTERRGLSTARTPVLTLH